jgi:hypothetical protein
MSMSDHDLGYLLGVGFVRVDDKVIVISLAIVAPAPIDRPTKVVELLTLKYCQILPDVVLFQDAILTVKSH